MIHGNLAKQRQHKNTQKPMSIMVISECRSLATPYWFNNGDRYM